MCFCTSLDEKKRRQKHRYILSSYRFRGEAERAAQLCSLERAFPGIRDLFARLAKIIGLPKQVNQ